MNPFEEPGTIWKAGQSLLASHKDPLVDICSYFTVHNGSTFMVLEHRKGGFEGSGGYFKILLVQEGELPYVCWLNFNSLREEYISIYFQELT